MDLAITGKFIKEQRKVQGLTQGELAAKLMVSEKTVSKWECGYGFPDTSLMLPLCEALKISANELLSARKLSSDEYKEQAEQNLVLLKQNAERNAKFLLTMEIVLGYLASISFMVLIFVASFIEMATGWRIGLIGLGLAEFVVGICFCLRIEKDAGFYECAHCHHKHVPTFKQVLWSMHMGRTRYMQCPACGKKSWQKKVTK